MKATVLHDENGRILAISKIEDLKKSGSKLVKAGMIARSGQRSVEINLSKELNSRPLRELHTEYRVDPGTSKLVRKTEPYQ
jgi:hypothetical protein